MTKAPERIWAYDSTGHGEMGGWSSENVQDHSDMTLYLRADLAKAAEAAAYERAAGVVDELEVFANDRATKLAAFGVKAEAASQVRALIDPDAASALDAVRRECAESRLSDLMEQSGMVPLDAITKPTCLGKYEAHAAMKDMAFFGEWVERKAAEYGKMQAANQTGARPMDDDLADFVLGKASAFSEVLANYRAALKE